MGKQKTVIFLAAAASAISLCVSLSIVVFFPIQDYQSFKAASSQVAKETNATIKKQQDWQTNTDKTLKSYDQSIQSIRVLSQRVDTLEQTVQALSNAQSQAQSQPAPAQPAPAPQADPAPAVVAPAANEVTVSAANGLNLRAKADTNAAIVAVLRNGQTVTLTGNKKTVSGINWIEVQDQAGHTGWVNQVFTK